MSKSSKRKNSSSGKNSDSSDLDLSQDTEDLINSFDTLLDELNNINIDDSDNDSDNDLDLRSISFLKEIKRAVSRTFPKVSYCGVLRTIPRPLRRQLRRHLRPRTVHRL